jgi:hypothetical protein
MGWQHLARQLATGPGSLPTCRGCPFQAKLAKLAKQDVIVLTQIFQISVANLNMKDRKMPKYHL